LERNFGLDLILSRGKGIDKLNNQVIAVSNPPIHVVVRGMYILRNFSTSGGILSLGKRVNNFLKSI